MRKGDFNAKSDEKYDDFSLNMRIVSHDVNGVPAMYVGSDC